MLLFSVKPVSLAKEKVHIALGPKSHVKGKKIIMDLEQNRRLKMAPGNRYKGENKGPDLEITTPQSVHNRKTYAYRSRFKLLA